MDRTTLDCLTSWLGRIKPDGTRSHWMASVKRISTGFESASSTRRSQEQLCRVAQQPRLIRREPAEFTDPQRQAQAERPDESRGFTEILWIVEAVLREGDHPIKWVVTGKDCFYLHLRKCLWRKFLRNRFHRNWQS